MTRRFTGWWSFTLLATIFFVGPAVAQINSPVAKPAGPLSYDISKETTLSGTVASVLAKPSPGMIMGAHLMIQTSSGVVDASLDRFALIGKDALQISGGEAVEVTGVMKNINGKQVFLARTVKAGNEVYTIRNQHGIALSPAARARLSQKSNGNGVQL